MKRKRRLKQWVKDAIILILMSCIGVGVIIAMRNSFDKTAMECDEYYGHICSLYEVQQYGKGIRR